MRKREGRETGRNQPRRETSSFESSEDQDAGTSGTSVTAHSETATREPQQPVQRQQHLQPGTRRGHGTHSGGRGNQRNKCYGPKASEEKTNITSSPHTTAYESHSSQWTSHGAGRPIHQGEQHKKYVQSKGQDNRSFARATSGPATSSTGAISQYVQSKGQDNRSFARATSGPATSSTGAISRRLGHPFASGLTVREKENVRKFKGRQTVVKANFFAFKHFCLERAFHYDVAITPDNPRRLLRSAMKEFELKNFPNCTVAFDGRKNLYTVTPLISDDEEIHDSIDVWDDEKKRQKKFSIILKFVACVDFTSLDQRSINVLDVVFRCVAVMKYLTLGRLYFPIKEPAITIGGGLEVRSGMFMSVRRGEHELFLNVDSVHKAFLKPQSIVNMIKDIHDSPQHVDLNKPLSNDHISQIRATLIGFKVTYSIYGNENSEDTVYQVRDVMLPPSELCFNFNGREITVENYYQHEKKVILKYPNLPCLNLGLPERPMYVPLELCNIIQGQAMHKKLNDRLNTAMIQQTVTNPSVRIKNIQDRFTYLDLEHSPLMKEFNVEIHPEFQKVEARVLDAPDVVYQNNSALHPYNGQWRTQIPFFEATSLKKWTIFILDKCVTQEQVSDFANQFEEQAKKMGLTVKKPTSYESIDTRRYLELENCLRRYHDYDLLFIVGFKNSKNYSSIKKIAELNLGVLTQFIINVTIKKIKNSDSVIYNIVQKVNAKLGGINHTLSETPLPVKTTTMYVGADVTHPSPGETKIPSVAAVCASYDSHGFKYRAIIRKQEKCHEIIEDLKEIMMDHLQFYESNTKMKPQNIVFCRDGVGEGQFEEVKVHELSAVKNACSSLDRNYKPAVTFLVVQKRHHARFFSFAQDHDERVDNVLPGTVVDKTITHPEECEFYLISHASVRGVSRPCRYHCLYDDNHLRKDELEKLAYSLCHLYSRCTRSVSYPAPTYYAHHAATRGKIYLSGQDCAKEPNDYLQKYSSVHQKLPPMHYV